MREPSRELEELLGRLSLEELEMLLLLARAPEKPRSANTAARELSITPHTASAALEQLTRLNLVDVRVGSDVMYRFAPVDARSGELVTELAELYAERRVLVIQRLRQSLPAVEAFAEAFRIKRRTRG